MKSVLCPGISIKSVLPALFPDDAAVAYKALDIQAGEVASMIYTDLDRIDKKAKSRKYANRYSNTASWTPWLWEFGGHSATL